jgi:hypothetical protein
MLMKDLGYEWTVTLGPTETTKAEKSLREILGAGTQTVGEDGVAKKTEERVDKAVQVDDGMVLESLISFQREERLKTAGVDLENRENEVYTAVSERVEMVEPAAGEQYTDNQDNNNNKLAKMESYASILLQNIENLVDEGFRKDEKLQHLTDELIKTRLTTYEVMDDEELRGLWTGLQYRVEQWITARCSSPAILTTPFQKHYASLLRRMSQNSLLYFKQDSTRPLILQGYVWNQLLRHVFSQQGQVWTSEALAIQLGYLRFNLGGKFLSLLGKLEDKNAHSHS